MSASRRRLSEPAGAAAREARSRSEGFRLEQISTRFAAGLDLPAILKGAQWFRPLPSARRLKPGAVPKQSLNVPQAHAQRILRGRWGGSAFRGRNNFSHQILNKRSFYR